MNEEDISYIMQKKVTESSTYANKIKHIHTAEIRIGEKQTKIRVGSWSVFYFTLIYYYKRG